MPYLIIFFKCSPLPFRSFLSSFQEYYKQTWQELLRPSILMLIHYAQGWRSAFASSPERWWTVETISKQLSFRFRVVDDESIGYARYSRLKMAEKQFGWYRGCSRPLEDEERFLLHRILCPFWFSAKLGGTARKEKLVPWDASLFVFIKYRICLL